MLPSGRRIARRRFVSALLTASQSFNRITWERVDYDNAFGLTRPRAALLGAGLFIAAR